MKTYDVRPDQSVPLLKALHILTRDGKLNQDSRRKLKQVYHLVQFIEPILQSVYTERGAVNVVDHGSGKSYLGFILYDLVLKGLENAWVYGIETRTDLVERCTKLAAESGFDRMRFLNMSVQESQNSPLLPKPIDLVTALHACNTATDDAIAFALAHEVPHIVLVPCCQAEVAQHLRASKAGALSNGYLAEIWRRPLHTREFGSHITNVLRCLQLEAHGYQLTVTELVGWEHAMKNELIIAKKVGKGKRSAAQRRDELLEQLGIPELKARFA